MSTRFNASNAGAGHDRFHVNLRGSSPRPTVRPESRPDQSRKSLVRLPDSTGNSPNLRARITVRTTWTSGPVRSHVGAHRRKPGHRGLWSGAEGTESQGLAGLSAGGTRLKR
jgi:hypothetical protein